MPRLTKLDKLKLNLLIGSKVNKEFNQNQKKIAEDLYFEWNRPFVTIVGTTKVENTFSSKSQLYREMKE